MTRGLGPTCHASWPGTKEAKPPHVERVTAPWLQALLHPRRNQRSKGRWRATAPRGRTPSALSHLVWRPRPTRHVTGAPVTTCKQPHRHLRQCRASSTAAPVPRLEATLRMAQQCQSSTTITGQSATGGGATVDMAKSGPAVMAAAGEQKQQSNHLQAHVPSWSSSGALSHDVKTTRPCSVPRTTRARATAAPRTARLVALTPRQGKQHLWQAKQAPFHLRHDDRVKKGAPHRLNSHPFPLPLSLSCYRDRERGSFERDPSPRRKRALSPPTDQGFEGWPLGRVRQPSQSTRASGSLLIRGSKAGPSEGFDNRLKALGLRAHY
jgi:dienelactone hydrolase